MRGERRCFVRHHRIQRRFIPACAGNASPSETGQRTSSVHPRMRGERALTRQRDQQVIGSSPHARGTPNGISPSKRNHRFIPACAGNARTAGRAPMVGPVHPRMRGERRRATLGLAWPAGSSPHARGTLLRLQTAQELARFIPACAGNAGTSTVKGPPGPVHPHMRGERRARARAAARASGSSPHARGTHELLLSFRRLIRFIPTCAGNALPISH